MTVTTAPPVPVDPAATKTPSGYWMLGAGGRVYAFGDARAFGDVVQPAPGRDGGRRPGTDPCR